MGNTFRLRLKKEQISHSGPNSSVGCGHFQVKVSQDVAFSLGSGPYAGFKLGDLAPSAPRCRATSAHIRQTRQNSGLVESDCSGTIFETLLRSSFLDYTRPG